MIIAAVSEIVWILMIILVDVSEASFESNVGMVRQSRLHREGCHVQRGVWCCLNERKFFM